MALALPVGPQAMSTTRLGFFRALGVTQVRIHWSCLLYTSDAADERSSVDLGGRRIIKKKKLTDHSADDELVETRCSAKYYTPYNMHIHEEATS